jgi:hypothetical protein
MELITAGRLDEARALRATYKPTLKSINHRCYSNWFGPGPGAALIDVELGDRDALRKMLEEGSRTPSGWGGRCAKVCAAALDPSRAEALKTMPWRTEVGAWLLVAQALHAEVSGDRSAALMHWQAYQALPMVDRLLQGHSPCVDLEAICGWRIALLSK